MDTSVRINNVALSASRLANIEAAETLSDAQRMGLFDRVVDWFRGGVKSEAIKQAFDFLHSPAYDSAAQYGGDVQHENMLLHFGVLHAALRPEHAGQCQLTVQRDDAQQTWSYKMVLDGKPLVSASHLPMQSGYALAAFEDFATLAGLGSYLQERYGADSTSQCNVLRERFLEINDRLAGQPSSMKLEKFRVVCDELPLLGAPSTGCFPAVEFSGDLSQAELVIGNHSFGTCAIVNQEVLTDTLSTMVHACASSVNQMLEARDVNAAVYKTVQDMVDDIGERKTMEENIQDPFFCKENFVKTEVMEGEAEGGGSKFSVTFRDKTDGKERTLVFSNRMPSNMEFRGDIARRNLAEKTYSSLAELIAQRFGGPEDSQIPYLTTPTRFGLMNFLDSLENDPEIQRRLGFSEQAQVTEYFQSFKESVIAPCQVGQTTLGDVWRLQAMGRGKMSPESRVERVADAAPQPIPFVGLDEQAKFDLLAHKA